MQKIYHLTNDRARDAAIEAVHDVPDGYVVTITQATRSVLQNSALWAALTDVAEQVPWHGDKLSAEAWKHVFSASLKKQDVVPGLHGDFVVIGARTSRMTKAEMSDLLELIFAFGAEHDVQFGRNEWEKQAE